MNRFQKVTMKKIYYIMHNKYRKFKNPKVSYIFDKTLVPYIICDKYGSEYEKNI